MRSAVGMTLLELLLSLSIGLPILAMLASESMHLLRLSKAQEVLFAQRAAAQRVSLELDAAAAWIDALNIPGNFKTHLPGDILRASGDPLLGTNPSAITKPGNGTAFSYVRALRVPLLKIESCTDHGQLLTGIVNLVGTPTVQNDQYRSALLLGIENTIEGIITLHGSGTTRSFAWQSCDGLFFPKLDPDCSAAYLVLLDSSVTLYSSAVSESLRLITSACETVLENQPIAESIDSIRFEELRDPQNIWRLSASADFRGKNITQQERRLSLGHTSLLQLISVLP